MQLAPRRINFSCTILSVAIGLLAGCDNPTERTDALACPQTYEFGNTGYFELAGKVVGSKGQALAGVFVRLRPVRGSFDGLGQTPDSTGSFRLRLSRMTGQPPAAPLPDTLSVYVIAQGLGDGFGLPAVLRDSILAMVTLAPVGAIPEPTQIRITLPVP